MRSAIPPETYPVPEGLLSLGLTIFPQHLPLARYNGIYFQRMLRAVVVAAGAGGVAVRGDVQGGINIGVLDRKE